MYINYSSCITLYNDRWKQFTIQTLHMFVLPPGISTKYNKMKIMAAKHFHSSDHTWQSCKEKNPVLIFMSIKLRRILRNTFHYIKQVYIQTFIHHVIMFQAMAFSPTAHKFTNIKIKVCYKWNLTTWNKKGVTNCYHLNIKNTTFILS